MHQIMHAVQLALREGIIPPDWAIDEFVMAAAEEGALSWPPTPLAADVMTRRERLLKLSDAFGLSDLPPEVVARLVADIERLVASARRAQERKRRQKTA
jgi:hypothetical protein